MPDVFAADIIGSEKYQRVKLSVGPPGSATDISPVDALPIRDPSLDLSLGLITGSRGIVIRGHNPSQTSASGFVDVSEFGDLTYLTSAETMEVASTSTDDDGDPAGIGLQTLFIEGVDNTGAEISETVTMNGTDDVTTVNSYLRINFITGLAVGSAGWNVGSITVTASSAATIQAEMDATEGVCQGSHFTVPLNKTLCIVQLEVNIAKIIGGASPTVEFKLYCRSGGVGNCWLQLFDKRIDSAVTNEMSLLLPFPSDATQAIARTDIRFTADTDQNSTEVRTRMYGILTDD